MLTSRVALKQILILSWKTIIVRNDSKSRQTRIRIYLLSRQQLFSERAELLLKHSLVMVLNLLVLGIDLSHMIICVLFDAFEVELVFSVLDSFGMHLIMSKFCGSMMLLIANGCRLVQCWFYTLLRVKLNPCGQKPSLGCCY